ncbi:MAG TPA: BTAD domain-containing putative transcriptional regulator [Chthonomonadaceae bacterium]|nr:BTAD domain-containing putative transcriptional regulator [Chthonomonadaceae bacterium]
MTWNIQLLGGLHAERGEQSIARFRTEQTGGLLAYLAYFQNQTFSREVLIGLLWPDATPQSGRQRLSSALSSLRHQFEIPDEGIVVFLTDAQTVRLQPNVLRTDVTEFETAQAALSETAPPAQQIEALERILALYRGPLLPDCYDEWVLPERERLADQYLHRLRQIVKLLTESKQFRRAIDYTHRAIGAAPYREELYRDLMVLYTRIGQPSAALQKYAELEAILDRPPSARTRALADEIAQRLAEAPSTEGAGSLDFRSRLLIPETGGMVTLLQIEAEPASEEWDPMALAQEHLRAEWGRYAAQELHAASQSRLIAFSGASQALHCALALNRYVTAHSGANYARLRMGLHTAEVTRETSNLEETVRHTMAQLLQHASPGQIVCSLATASLLQPTLAPTLQLRSLGPHRVQERDQDQPLLVALTEETLEPSEPSSAAPSIPSSLTRFFGRQEEQTHLRERLRRPGTRLLTLKGPGGIGKTRLALELANALQADYGSAIWFVSLGDLTQAPQIPERILETLQVVSDGGTLPLEQIVLVLGGRAALLILDNFEQLVGEGARIVRTLLERLPELRCLVTSRRKLNLDGEQEWTVQPLPLPGETASLAQLMGYASVQLFVDRAQAVNPGFEVTEKNASAVAQLCDRLDGIPLAIELAASRTQMFTPQQMLTKLADRFAFLKQNRDVVERQRTMHGAITWSYSLLTPELQRFFSHLSLFRGGWTLEAAEAVCREELAQDYLAQLLECSLILAEERGEEIRFRMLETLREFAAQQLPAEDRPRIEGQHFAFFLGLAEEAVKYMTGPEQALWLDRLGAEHDNLRVALQQDQDPEQGLRFAGALTQFWYVRDLREGLANLERALQRGQAAPDEKRAGVLLGACMFATAMGRYDIAKRYGEEALATHRRLGDPRRIAATLNNLSFVAQRQGDLEKGLDYLGQALALYRALDETRQIGVILTNLGELANSRGDYTAALNYLEEAYTLATQSGDQYCLAAVLLNLGVARYHLGHQARARRLLQRSLLLWAEFKEGHQIINVLNWLAILAQEQGEDVWAARLFGVAHSVQESAGATLTPDTEKQVSDAIASMRNRMGALAFETAFMQGGSEGLTHALAAARESHASDTDEAALKDL